MTLDARSDVERTRDIGAGRCIARAARGDRRANAEPVGDPHAARARRGAA
ncbi:MULTISPECIES: hypothetical protein [Burkholderia]|nr:MULTISPECIES: hypothetical protein [Burkholderia]MDF3099247.1 hypothetical protein [Burkholderia semiarida]